MRDEEEKEMWLQPMFRLVGKVRGIELEEHAASQKPLALKLKVLAGVCSGKIVDASLRIHGGLEKICDIWAVKRATLDYEYEGDGVKELGVSGWFNVDGKDRDSEFMETNGFIVIDAHFEAVTRIKLDSK